MIPTRTYYSDFPSGTLPDIYSNVLFDILSEFYLAFYLTSNLTFYLAFYLTYILTFYLTFYPAIYLAFFLTVYPALYLSGIHADILLVYILAFFPAFFKAFILALSLASMLTFYLAFYLTYILTVYLTFFLAFCLTYVLAFYLAIFLAFYLTCVRVQSCSSTGSGAGGMEFGPRRAHSIRTLQYGVRLQACQHSELATWGSGPGVLRSLRGWRWGSGHKAQQGRRWGEGGGGGVVPLLKSGDPHWQVWKNKTCLSLSLFPLSA